MFEFEYYNNSSEGEYGGSARRSSFTNHSVCGLIARFHFGREAKLRGNRDDVLRRISSPMHHEGAYRELSHYLVHGEGLQQEFGEDKTDGTRIPKRSFVGKGGKVRVTIKPFWVLLGFKLEAEIIDGTRIPREKIINLKALNDYILRGMAP